MGEATWLKVRSDLYPGAYPSCEITNGDNALTDLIASETQDTDAETQEQLQPRDWEPNQPCNLCTVHSTNTMGEHHEQHPVSVVSNRNDLITSQREPRSPDPPPQDANLPTDEIQVTSNEVSTSSNIITSNANEVFGTKLGLKLRTDLCASSNYVISDDSYINIQDGNGGLDLSATSRYSPTLLPPLPLGGSAVGGPLPLPPGGLTRLFPGLVGASSGGGAPPAPQTPLDLYTANLPPHLLPWILSTHLQQLARAHQENQGMLNSPSGEMGFTTPSSPSMIDMEQKPLDLSAKAPPHPLTPHHPLTFPTHSVFGDPSESLRAKAIVDAKIAPSSRGRRRGDMSKRTYTEVELQAALRDIQSGKLGTRRAAVIYGIPRSTLRNKVYKLAMERERSKKLAEELTKVESTTSAPVPGHPVICNSQAAASPFPVPSGDNFQNLLRIRVAEKLEELNQKGQVSLNGAEKDKDQVVESVLKPLMDNIANLALNKDNKELPMDIQSSISFYPQLSNFIKGIVEERYNEELRRSKLRTNGLNNIYPLDGSKEPSNDLSVPSYSPSCNGGNSDDRSRDSSITSQSLISSIGNSNLRDMLVQMIGHKGMENGVVPESNESMNNCQPSNMLVWDSKTMSLQPQTKKFDSSSNSASGKGSRPKRGKYRNYDRENLLKAVQAVQSGDMSVHRAGSFYGVPHSTLEYKVKERHLNRGKNKKDSPNGGDFMNSPSMYSLDPQRDYSNDASNDNTISSTIDLTQDDFSKNFESLNDIQPALKRVKTESEAISPFTPFSSTSLSTSPLTDPTIPSTPILSSPFSLWHSPFYASQMMRRIHEIAAKNNPMGQSTSPVPDREQSSSPTFLPTSISSTSLQDTVQTSAFQGSMLDKLLRSKTISPGLSESNNPLSRCTQLTPNSGSIPTRDTPTWLVSSSLIGLNKGIVIEQPTKSDRDAIQPIIPPQDMMPFSTFPSLPSMLAVRSTLAAALQRQTTPPRSPLQDSTADSPPPRQLSPQVDIMPVPMLKEIPHSTPVGADQP